MNFPSDKQRGFALIAVIGILAVLLVYLVAVQGSVNQTVRMDDVGRVKIERAESLAAVAALAPAMDTTTTKTLTSKFMDFEAQVKATPLGADDPLFHELPGMRHRAGDMELNIRWTGGPAAGTSDRVLINNQARRQGIVRLASNPSKS